MKRSVTDAAFIDDAMTPGGIHVPNKRLASLLAELDKHRVELQEHTRRYEALNEELARKYL